MLKIMAEDKKAVLLYCDIIHTVEKLKDKEAGKLFKHYLRYINDLNPESDTLTEIVFEPIKQSLKRDLQKYLKTIGKKSDAGTLGNLKRYNLDLYTKVVNKDLTLQQAKELARTRKNSQGDTKLAVSDKDKGSVIDKDKDILLNKINNKEFLISCIDDLQFMEVTAMQTKSNIPEVVLKLNTFENYLIQTSDQKKKLSDFKKHFTNWSNRNTILNKTISKKVTGAEAFKNEILKSMTNE